MSNSEISQYHLHKNEPEKLQFEIYPLSDYLASGGDHTRKPHTHTFYQIIWFESGKGKHYVDFNEYEVNENSIFFIPKGQVHYFDNSNYQGYIIHFNESFISDHENYIKVFLKHNIFDSFEKEPLFQVKKNDIREIHNIIEQMQTEILTPNQFAHKEYLKLLLHLLLIAVQRFGIRKDYNRLSVNNPTHILFVKFRQLLETNYHNVHTVTEYANFLHVSNKTLTNCTKEISRQTPLEIINDRITLEAKRLFAYSDKNVSEIGFDLGFEDPSYFVKFFKKHSNKTPTEFRKIIS